MNDNFYALPAWNTHAKIAKKTGPYIYEEYNVRCFTANPLSEVKQVPERLVNCLIKALNENNKLPRIVVVIPDWDLVRYMQIFYGIESAAQKIISWIADNMIKSVKAKEDELYRKKPGAVVYGKPKFIWVKMINRFNGEFDRHLTVRSKYNRGLELAMMEKRNHYIIDPNEGLNDPAYFTQLNDLNGDGRIKFWKILDNNLKDFDYQRKSLKLAIANCLQPQSSWASHDKSHTNYPHWKNNPKKRKIQW